jgi:hypothetical protein
VVLPVPLLHLPLSIVVDIDRRHAHTTVSVSQSVIDHFNSLITVC